jgi:four helix bundle protein
MKILRFEEILAWQKARELVREVYRMTNSSEGFKKDFGLKDQIRRAAVSSMSNIAEGFGRLGDREFANFLNIASGSVAEVQSQLYVALDLQYIDQRSFSAAYSLAEESSRLLTNFMKYLKNQSIKTPSIKTQSGVMKPSRESKI